MRTIKYIALFNFGVSFVILLAYQTLSLPESSDTSSFFNLDIAHRGDTLDHLEHTLSAYQSAFDKGVDAIEVDVHLTKDLKLAVIHDDTVNRISGERGAVKDFTMNELQELKLIGHPSNKILSLDETMKMIKAKNLKLEIEVKSETHSRFKTAKRLTKLFQKHDMYASAFVSSFDPRILYYVRNQDKKIVTSLSYLKYPPYGRVISYVFMSEYFLKFLGIGIVGPEKTLVNKESISKWKSQNLLINVWGVETLREKQRLLGKKLSVTNSCLSLSGC